MTDPKDRGQDPAPAAEAGATYDVFLSHNSDDKPAVMELARRLRDAGLEPFLDAWHLVPGEPWQEALETAIDASRTCVVFVGPAGFGTWENEEMRAALSRRAANPEFRVIPAILPGAVLPDRGRLPRFLSRLTWVDFRPGLDDAAAFDRLVDGIRGVAPDTLDESELGDAPIVCPFRGLEVFDEDHADYFFGREALTQYLVEQLRTDRFLAVVGASGSGKSSVVRAGLVPQVRGGALPDSAAWPVVIVRPGAHPMEALASRLGAVLQPGTDALAARQSILVQLRENERGLHAVIETTVAAQDPDWRVLIVVDQFEELFTLCHDDAEREAFVDTLLHASSVVGGQTVVVVTMRADFFGRCATLPVLAARLAERDVLVPPMEEEDLRRCIVEPAEKVGLQYEKGLVDTILEELGSEPGSLPLLEHTLLELFEGRRGRWLTIDRYHEIGGVQGAIAQRAEAVYANLAPEQQAAARRVLLRLTAPGEGTEDTRRRASVTELLPSDASPDAVEAVVNQLADARLLVTSETDTGDEIVDVAHEALIRGWPRLQGWIKENPAGLRLHRRITETATEWEAAKRDASYLLGGQRLDEALRWANSNDDDLNDLERDFLAASEAARRREIASRRRRVRLALVGTAVAFVAVSVAGVFAAWNWMQAERNERASGAQYLLATGQGMAPADPMSGLALAFEGLDKARGTPLDPDRFLAGIGRMLAAGRYAYLGPAVEEVYANPSGSRLVVDVNGAPGAFVDTADGSTIAPLAGEVLWATFPADPGAGVFAVTYEDDSTPAGGVGRTELRLLSTGAVVPLTRDDVGRIDIDPESSLLIVSYGVPSDDGDVAEALPDPAPARVAGVATVTGAPDEGAAPAVELRSTVDGVVRPIPEGNSAAWFTEAPQGPLISLQAPPDDSVLLVSGRDGTPVGSAEGIEYELVGAKGDRVVMRKDDRCVLKELAGTTPILAIPKCGTYILSPDRTLVAFITKDGGGVWRIADGRPLADLPAGTEMVEFSPDPGSPRMVVSYTGTSLASGATKPDELRPTTGETVLLRLDSVTSSYAEEYQEEASLTFSADGKYLYASTRRKAAVYDAATGDEVRLDVPGVAPDAVMTYAAFGRTPGGPAVIDFSDGSRAIVDLERGAVLQTVATSERVWFWAGDGPLLVSGQLLDTGVGRHAQLRDPATGDPVTDLGGFWIDNVAYSDRQDAAAGVVVFSSGYAPQHDAAPEIVGPDGAHVPLEGRLFGSTDEGPDSDVVFDGDASALVVHYTDGRTQLWDRRGTARPLIDLGLGIRTRWVGATGDALAVWDQTGAGYLLDLALLRSMPAGDRPLDEAEAIGRFCGLLQRTGDTDAVPVWFGGRCS